MAGMKGHGGMRGMRGMRPGGGEGLELGWMVGLEWDRRGAGRVRDRGRRRRRGEG